MHLDRPRSLSLSQSDLSFPSLCRQRQHHDGGEWPGTQVAPPSGCDCGAGGGGEGTTGKGGRVCQGATGEGEIGALFRKYAGYLFLVPFLRPREWLLPMAVLGVASPLVRGSRLLLGVCTGSRRPCFPLDGDHRVVVPSRRLLVPPVSPLVRHPRR